MGMPIDNRIMPPREVTYHQSHNHQVWVQQGSSRYEQVHYMVQLISYQSEEMVLVYHSLARGFCVLCVELSTIHIQSISK
jgi:hypothetical protein